jgi:hypothetical protein
MTLRLGALHDALLTPGDAELARKAAEEVAASDNRLASIDRRLSLLTWMVGFLIGIGIAGFWMLCAILERLPS